MFSALHIPLMVLGLRIGKTAPIRRELSWKKSVKLGPDGRCLKLGIFFTREPNYYIHKCWHLRLDVGFGSRSWNGAGYKGCRSIFLARNAKIAMARYHKAMQIAQAGDDLPWPSYHDRLPWQAGITGTSNMVPCPSGY